MNPVIGVVTVTYNSADVLEDFLRSLRAQMAEFRLYAVDNASSDASVEILRNVSDPWMTILEQDENLGIAVGNNVGIRRALHDGCDWIVLLNNDTTFEPTLLESLVRTAETESASVVVPSIRYFDEPDQVWFESATFADWRGSVPVARPPADGEDAVAIECACTCCALIDPAVFDSVGLMDERFFVYWDDTDFFYRCHVASVPLVLDPRIRVLHKVSSLTGGGESVFSQTERTKNRVVFIRKHHRRWRRWIGLTATAVNALWLTLGAPPRRERARQLWAAYHTGLRVPVG
jgi:GT2 family glycosyltransferase